MVRAVQQRDNFTFALQAFSLAAFSAADKRVQGLRADLF